MRQSRPVVLANAAGAQLVLIQPADRAQHPHHQLRGTHFHTEHRDRHVRVERDVFGDVQAEGGVVRDHILVGDVQPLRMADGNALALGFATRFDAGESQAFVALPGFREAREFFRLQQQRTRLRVVDVADMCGLAGSTFHVVFAAKMRLFCASRTPTAERAHQFGNVLGQLPAGSGDSDAAPARGTPVS